MIELRERECLSAEAFARGFVAQCTLGQDFYGHVAVELLIVGPVHHTHSAFAELLDDAIVADNFSNHSVTALRVILGRDWRLVNAPSETSGKSAWSSDHPERNPG